MNQKKHYYMILNKIKRKEAIFDFRPQETKDFNESLNMTKNNELKTH